ncbi:hypothetical protein WISP_116171 [Willisornis vidua]|uniref:Endonuclease/exonuclease/phosphatase domain-containing protein n=1 Tax=Willisornis vidua TaxID=1566151 RepID=A0ABQ9CTY9_9PASS|nr:hypothetical protein WISP_116171 [Willisornis vidua]
MKRESHNEAGLLAGLVTLWKGPMAEELMKNCRKGFILEIFLEDCLLLEGLKQDEGKTMWSVPHVEKGAAETMCNGLTAVPHYPSPCCEQKVKELRNEAESRKKTRMGSVMEWCGFLSALYTLHSYAESHSICFYETVPAEVGGSHLLNTYATELSNPFDTIMGDFNLLEINREHHTAGTTWARRFLKNLDDSFMEQVLRELTQKDLLVLLLVNKVDLVSEVDIGDHLGHRDHEGIKFKISVDRRKSDTKTPTLDMRRADFRLLREDKSSPLVTFSNNYHGTLEFGRDLWRSYSSTPCSDWVQLEFTHIFNVSKEGDSLGQCS